MMPKMKYRYLNKREEELVVIKILDTLLDPSLPYSGEHRRKQWEKGWGQNLKEKNLTPHYFGKHAVNRLNGRFVVSSDANYELKKLYSVLEPLAKRYLAALPVVCEFGCGTGHNLKQIQPLLKKHEVLVGLDWATSSQEIVSSFGSRFAGINFDFFKPNRKLHLSRFEWGAYTVAALEQTGTKYKKFVDYLLKNKPKIVVHIEPIPELLDPTKLNDYLSIKYMEKRKYLSGYLAYLRTLEKQKKLKILEARRSGVGSLFIDGYSIIVWRPL